MHRNSNIKFEVISHETLHKRNYIPVTSAKLAFKKGTSILQQVHVFLIIYTVSNEQCLQTAVWIKSSVSPLYTFQIPANMLSSVQVSLR